MRPKTTNPQSSFSLLVHPSKSLPQISQIRASIAYCAAPRPETVLEIARRCAIASPSIGMHAWSQLSLIKVGPFF